MDTVDGKNALALVPAQKIAAAIQLYNDAIQKQEDMLSTITESEVRMSELQVQAEEAHLSVVEAESAAKMARDELSDIVQQINIASEEHLEALAILEEAKRLVMETEEKLRVGESRKLEVEQGMIPVLMQLGSARTHYERFLALADIENSKMKQIISQAEGQIAASRVAVCDAKLQLLTNPSSLFQWPEIKGFIGEV